ncbi:DNA translocase FtsK [Streptomyces sp. enrichment culture]|uniref:DNA translocase FtsK n=1 Tax=Streptomyces sp. enrichment culture TaxID=1795815 RepID=UPI003F55343B
MPHIDLLYAATKLVTESRFGSPSMLRRCLRRDYEVSVPFEICEHLLDLMERHGIVGPARGSLAREVLMDYEEASKALLSSRGGSWGVPAAA